MYNHTHERTFTPQELWGIENIERDINHNVRFFTEEEKIAFEKAANPNNKYEWFQCWKWVAYQSPSGGFYAQKFYGLRITPKQ